jgi:hypothetical protein
MTIRELNPGDWFLHSFSKDVFIEYDLYIFLEHGQELAQLVMFDKKGKCLGLRKLRETVEVQPLGDNIRDVW